MYAAQEIPQIDTEIAQKGHFRMETELVITDVFSTIHKQLFLGNTFSGHPIVPVSTVINP